MEIEPRFNYDSLRSQKARFSVRFGNAWHIVAIAVGIMMVLLGLWSLIEHGAIGWLLFGLSGPMIMVSIWWEKDLKTTEISKILRRLTCDGGGRLGQIAAQTDAD